MKPVDGNAGYPAKALVCAVAMFLALLAVAVEQEAPDVLVKRVSQQVMEIARVDRNVQGGSRKHLLDLTEEAILPHVDFERATAMAAGRSWREATPDQQRQLTNEFRKLLTYTYSGALSRVKDQKLEFKPFRADPSATEVEVRSEIVQEGRAPVQLDYRLEKTPSG